MLAVLLLGKDQLNVAVIDFLRPYEAWKELFRDLETDFVFPVEDDLRGKYFDPNVKIFFDFKGRIRLFVRMGVSSEIDIIWAIVSVVKKLLDPFLDSGNFFLVGSLQELLGHFGLDVKQ